MTVEACSWGQHKPHVACVRVFIHTAVRLLCLCTHVCICANMLAFVLGGAGAGIACLHELHWGP